jgi:hypothetical protein
MLWMKNRWLVAVCLSFGITAPTVGLAQQPIRIGATTALSGESSIQGGYSREGYLLRQKHVNEKGGVLGRQIGFVIYDDISNGKTAAGLYGKLIVDDKVDAVLGPYGSAITAAVADVNEKHRKLMIAPTAASTSDRGRCVRGASVPQLALLLRTSTEEITWKVGCRADIVPALFFGRQVSGVLETRSAR